MKVRKTARKKTRFLWITDPWHTLDFARDTTLRLAEEALKLGHECYWADVKSIRIDGGRSVLTASRLLSILPERDELSFEFAESSKVKPSEFDSVHYRTDPPIDLAYLQPLQILALGLEGTSSELVNPFEVLFALNEKLAGSALQGFYPPSLATSSWEDLEAFGKSEKVTVVKPLHKAQSLGVELLDWRTKASREHAFAHLRSETEGFTRPVLLQKFLKGITAGEQRLWFLDGELIGSVKKLPLSGDFRVNMDRGSQVVPTSLNAREKKAAAALSAYLNHHRIRLAAVDLIDGYVTDLNFTSPGLITKMEEVLGVNLSERIIKTLSQGSPHRAATARRAHSRGRK